MRKPQELVHINLRLHEHLRRRLEQEAARHRFTLTNEIRLRLEDSLDSADKRDLEAINMDLKTNWHRFAARFLSRELADQLADAVVKGAAPEKIRALAQLIIKHREDEKRADSLEGSVS